MAPQKVDVVVHGGTVVTATTSFEASVAIQGEQIVAVGPQEFMPDAELSIDATGKYVLPGAIDCHAHFGNADDHDLGPRAGALAGLTTVIPFMHYNRGEGETLPDAINRMKKELSTQTVLDYTPHFVLGPQDYIVDGIGEAIRMGVTSFKMFMTYKKGGGMCTDAHIAKAMDQVAAHGGIMQLHAENGDVIDYLEDKFIAEGRIHPRDFSATCPPWVEEEAVNRGINIAAMTGCPSYIVHLSTATGLERIKEAQRQGQVVWTETVPHYLLLDEGEMERLGPYAKVGPPLRSADRFHQEGLWSGLRQGYVSAIGSDHAPAPNDRREPGWQNIFKHPDDGKPIPFGAPSVETIVRLVYSEGVVKRNFPITWMARVLGENPARMFGLYPRKGAIRPGSDADLLIYDPDYEGTIRAADLMSNAGYTPYEGWSYKGRPWMTLLRGQVVLKDGDVQQESGYGQFLPAGKPMAPIMGAVE